jgi:hypothetical protein
MNVEHIHQHWEIETNSIFNSLVVVFFFFVLSKILLFTQKEKKPIETKPDLRL